ncbi:MAG: family 1 glycosylhydrolase, partial [Clostridia bacterium]|nr:family 1 glycosylhydrolase [Clostridia bacterium]
MQYKDLFLFGVSSSAFQIEGDDGTQGRGLSVWDEFSLKNGVIYNGQNASIACDHYNRFQEDVELMGELGIDSYRFSTSWSRLLPNGVGDVNIKGIDFYNRLIDALLGKNIVPCLTLYHWDLPEKLSQKGGFKNPDFPNWFSEYADLIAKKYGDRVKTFIVFNEPINCVHSSYVSGVFAPGERLNERQ